MVVQRDGLGLLCRFRTWTSVVIAGTVNSALYQKILKENVGQRFEESVALKK